eukprot:8211943-Pyramimonas_sp.AAC.1
MPDLSLAPESRPTRVARCQVSSARGVVVMSRRSAAAWSCPWRHRWSCCFWPDVSVAVLWCLAVA